MKRIWVAAVLMIGSMGTFGLSPSKLMNADSNDFILDVYPGSKIVSFHHNDSIETTFLQGLNSYEDPNTWKSSDISGENSVVVYEIPGSSSLSTHKVFQSLVNHIQMKDGKQFIQCSGVKQECGFYFPRKLATSPLKKSYYDRFSGFYMLNYGDFYFYSGELNVEGESFAVAVIVSKEKSRNIQYSVDVVKTQAASPTALVSYRNKISDSIEKTGKAVLGGLFFEFDKTELKDSSFASLEQIALYINENQDQDFFVVGHTDSSGTDRYNLSLSDGRAAEVVNRLMEDFGVSNDVLRPVGMGFRSPIASNSTPDGMAQNRRVELILSTSDAGKKIQNYLNDSFSDEKSEVAVDVSGEKRLNDEVHSDIQIDLAPDLDVPEKDNETNNI